MGFLTYVVSAVCSVPLIYFVKRYFGGGVCKSEARIDGKVVIITGANSGIGKETAIDLAKRGGKIYMACRDMVRGEAAVEDVARLSQSQNVHFMQLDLASLKSIRQFASKFLEAEPNLHILVNNAGVMQCPFMKTEDGFEMQMGTNHLGHFLLTNLLLDRLKAAGTAEANSRVVNVSSIGHEFTRSKTFNFSAVNVEDGYDPREAYFQSKLANILFTRALSKRISGTHIIANSLHPGFVRTELARYVPFMQSRVFFPILWLFFKTSEQGAQTSIHCAVSEDVEGVSGKYFSDCAIKEEKSWARDDAAAERLWELSSELVKLDEAMTDVLFH